MSTELQQLWQSQPLDEGALTVQPKTSWPDERDHSLPTSRFGRSWSAVRMPWVAVAAVLLVFVLINLVVRQVVRPAPVVAPPAVADEVEDLLAECRTFASPEAGSPDWARAEEACVRPLELSVADREATTLLKRISTLRACEANFNAGVDAEARRETEAAVEAYARLTTDCEVYLLRALPRVRALLPTALARATDRCGGSGVCEELARLECQRGSLEGDPRYAAFLAQRPGWACPEWVAFRPPPVAGNAVPRRELVRARFADQAIAEAVVRYLEGDITGARDGLTAVLKDPARQTAHAQARALGDDLQVLSRLLLQVSFELNNDAPRWQLVERDARAALELDARVLLQGDATRLSSDELSRALRELESAPRRELVREVSRAAYEHGKHFADRKDFRASCRVWKVGAAFSRADLDLLKALTNVCTRKAVSALDEAHTCEQLRVVLDFAVDGDGVRERAEEALEKSGCL